METFIFICCIEWDEREEIADPDATKPEDWDKPEHIADPDATKPDDWDDDMDGEWEPPMVDNPEFKGSFFSLILLREIPKVLFFVFKTCFR